MGTQRVTGYLVHRTGPRGDYWCVRKDYGTSPDGKRIQPMDEHRYATEAEAQRRLDEIIYWENRGPRTDPTPRTIRDLLIEWMETEQRMSVQPHSLASIETICRLHLIPAFGTLQARALSVGQIECWQVAKLADGASRHLVTRATLHLSQALKYAIRHSYLTHNPTDALRPLPAEHHEMQVWTPDEATTFLATANQHSYHPLWLLALKTGARKGELIGLQWADLDGHVLRIRRSLTWQEGTLEAGGTKNRTPRTVDLDRDTVGLLREWKARQNEQKLALGTIWQEGGWICTSEIGTPINPYNVNRALDMLIKEAKVPRIRFHDLRHTCASILLGKGVPVHVVSRMLGHANAAITLRVYAHLMPGQGEQAAEVLRKALERR